MTLKNLVIDNGWTLFLDRDGVINKRLPGEYVRTWEEFEFLPGVLQALPILSGIFGKILVVTNQQGIGKGFMTEAELELIHDRMIREIRYEGGRILKVYYSPFREEEKSVFRKPGPGMARKAKIDFPEIEFHKSVMIGDSVSDMHFGKNLGMVTIFLSPEPCSLPDEEQQLIDLEFPDLLSAANYLVSIKNPT